MSSREEQTRTGGVKNEGKESPQDQTLTAAHVPEGSKPRTLSRVTTPGTATVTFGGRGNKAIETLTRTAGSGTGELVDKINWEIGDVIDGRFEVLEVLGQGGMGIVYKINHREWRVDLAVKMPLAYLVADEDSKARFIREAETWVDLGLHPNIVQCLYVRELGGIPRVFMDYIEGGSLKDWIQGGQVKPGEWDTILDLIIQACDGLGYANERGVEVHRDVKPGNMLLTRKGDLLVTDFGIAKREGMPDIQKNGGGTTLPGHHLQTLTGTGADLGTPEYGAPEQWGEARYADTRADIYGLGVILFELCCGRRPFDDGIHREPPHVLIGRHLSTPAPDPRSFNQDIPLPLSDIILKCLRKDPEQRPPSMTDLRKGLTEIYREVLEKNYRRMVPQAADLRSDALNNRGVSFLDLEQEPDAFSSWTEALKLDAYHPESLYNNLLLQWRYARLTDEDVLRQLEEAKHVSRRSNFYIGLFHLERGAATEAEEELTNALEDSELAENGSVWRALGDARLSQGKFTLAAEAYHTALTLIPGDTESLERQTLAVQKTRQQEERRYFLWQRCHCSFENGHQAGVTSVAMTSDGRYAVSGSEDKTLRLWKLPTHESLWVFKGHDDSVLSVAITADGQYAVSGSQDKTLKIWECATGKCLKTLRGHTGAVNVVAITPDGYSVVSGSRDKTLRMWDLKTGRCAWTSDEFANQINTLAITPDSSFALSGHDDENLYLWDLAKGKLTERKYYGSSLEVLGFYWSPVSSLAITADGTRAVAGNKNATLRLWNIATGQVLQTLRGHEENVGAVAVTPDGHLIVSGSDDTNVCLWDMDSEESLWTFEGHKDNVSGLAIGQGGELALSGSLDSTLRLWNLGSREWLWTFWGEQGHRDVVTTVSPALHGRFVISGSDDGQLRLWDPATARCLRTYNGHQQGVTCVTGTQDGQFALSGSRDTTLLLWDLGSSRFFRRFKGHRKPVTAVVVTPDGKFVISCSEDRTIRVWDVETAECLHLFKGHEAGITSLAMTPDGRFLVSGSKDKTLRLWNIASGKFLRSFEGHDDEVNTVAIMSDGRFIASGSQDCTIRLWYLSTGKCLRVFEGHRAGVNAVAISEDKRFILSGGNDRTLRMWNLATARCLRTFQGHKKGVTALTIMPDGEHVVTASKDTTLRVWNIDTANAQRYEAALQLCRQRNHEELQLSTERFRKRMAWAQTAWGNGKAAAAYRYLIQARAIAGYERAPESLKLNADISATLPRRSLRGEWLLWTSKDHQAGITALAFTPDGRVAASGSADMTLRTWDLTTGKCLQLFDGHWLGVTSVAITPDGRFLVSGSEDATLRLWDLVTAKCLRIFKGHSQDVTALTVSQCGQFIISGSKDGTVRMWNPSTTECLQVLTGHQRGVTTVAISADRRFVVSGSEDRTLRLWERSSGKCLRTFKGHRRQVSAVAISPDGQFLLSGSRDKTLRLWNPSTATCFLVLKGHEGELNSLALISDGRFALSASHDRTLRLWNLATGKQLWIFRGHTQRVNAVAVSSDGRFLISGSEDNTLRFCELDWELELNDVVEQVGEGESESHRFLNRITSLFRTTGKK